MMIFIKLISNAVLSSERKVNVEDMNCSMTL